MRRDVRGFTLIELLIVITILGILSVLGARQFGDAVLKASANVDFSNAQIIENATRNYLYFQGLNYTTVKIGSFESAQTLKFDDNSTIDLSPYLDVVPPIKCIDGLDWVVKIYPNNLVHVCVGNDSGEYAQLVPLVDIKKADGNPYSILGVKKFVE